MQPWLATTQRAGQSRKIRTPHTSSHTANFQQSTSPRARDIGVHVLRRNIIIAHLRPYTKRNDKGQLHHQNLVSIHISPSSTSQTHSRSPTHLKQNKTNTKSHTQVPSTHLLLRQNREGQQQNDLTDQGRDRKPGCDFGAAEEPVGVEPFH